MRITGLKLENFRGFNSLEMDFHPKLTVLVGINGCGKTTILDAVAAAMGYSINQGFPISAKDLKRHAAEGLIDLSFRTGDSGGELHDKFIIERNGATKHVDPQSRLSLEDFDLVKGPLPILCYFAVDRHATDTTPDAKPPILWHANSAWNINGSDRQFTGLFHWFREREDLENQEYREDVNYTDPQLTAVRTALERLLPGYSKPRVRRPKPGTDANEVDIDRPVLAITKDGEELAFDQLSEGERTMAALTCDIARRLSIANPKSVDPLTGDGVVLIDEIDLHLHPEWQRKAIPALQRTFRNIQFLVATHSPIVLGHVPTECVRLLENFSIVDAPPTRGRDPNSLYLEVFDVPLREDDAEDKIRKIANLIDENKLTEARKQLDILGKALGEGDAEYIRLSTLITMLEN
ncbi:MAG: AAA family ATPase [Proteobacteria bacterium]|nr:AAA family ATPase [Pseudomonadota bacterium]